MTTLLQDLRFGIRTLAKAPGVAAIAVVALALGIGANTAMFSIVSAVLLKPLPYADPGRLVQLSTSTPQFRDASVSYPNFLDWQRQSHAFDSMAAYRFHNFNLTGNATPDRLRGQMMSATMFDTLGVKPILGRTFSADEDRRGSAPVVLLTSNVWQTRFGGDPHVLGRSLTLNDQLYTVIGVVPSDDVLWRRVSVIVPIGQWAEPLFWNRAVGMGMRVVGRLSRERSLPSAQSELDRIASGLAKAYPTENKDHGIYVVSLAENLTGDVRTPLLVLLGAVGFVLVMACANVANLLLARATGRRREFAIRTALGASRGRIVRQLLTECLLLAAAGGSLGLLVAKAFNTIVVAKIESQLPRTAQSGLDGSVLAFTAAVALGASFFFGLAPALRAARPDLTDALKEGDRGNTSRPRLLAALVVVEVALGLVLTTSAGLMVRTMSQLWSVNPGFDPQHVLTFGIAGSPSVHGTPAAMRNGVTRTVDRIRSAPGIAAASVLVGSVPMNGDSELPYWVEGRPKPAEQSLMDQALFYGVDPDYLNVMRIPLRRGRFLTLQDTEHTPCAVAVDEDFVAKAFPNQEPLGQHVNLELLNMKCEVVGVVGHVKHWGLDADATSKIHSQLYIAFRQFPDSVMDIAATSSDYVVRTDRRSVFRGSSGQAVGAADQRQHGDVRRREHGGRDRRLPFRASLHAAAPRHVRGPRARARRGRHLRRGVLHGHTNDTRHRHPHGARRRPRRRVGRCSARRNADGRHRHRGGCRRGVRRNARDEGASVRRQRVGSAHLRCGRARTGGADAPGQLHSGASRDQGRPDGGAPLRVVHASVQAGGQLDVNVGAIPELAAA